MLLDYVWGILWVVLVKFARINYVGQSDSCFKYGLACKIIKKENLLSHAFMNYLLVWKLHKIKRWYSGNRWVVKKKMYSLLICLNNYNLKML